MTTETILTDPMATDLAWEYATGITEVRAIEQAVLKSEQVRALRKDAERYGWLRDRSMIDIRSLLGVSDFQSLNAYIDAAMEQ